MRNSQGADCISHCTAATTATGVQGESPAMSGPPDTAPQRPGLPGARIATQCAVLFSSLILAVWIWSRICRFPSIPWNDMRLAPTIALAQGWSVFSTATEGTISTWMYGPLPLLFFWPASWANTAADALIVAGVLNVLLTLVPLAVVCFAWPTGVDRPNSILGRGAAFLLCLALWPELHYSVHFSDNLAVACGLVGNLMLVRARSSRELWLAAIVATAALACKQISIGIPLAQVIWMGVVHGRSAAIRHAARCILAGIVIGVLGIAAFGWAGLWFTLVEVPYGLEWAAQPMQRLQMVAPELALYLGVPPIIMIARRAIFSSSPLLLPSLAWICTLPLGVAGFFKVGGWTNSIYSFVLWLPAVLTTFLAAHGSERRRQAAQLAAVIMATAIASGRVVKEPDFALRPQVAAYREAEQLAEHFPRAIWFPVHPLITLYSDHSYYHDEDGFYIRMKAHKRYTPDQVAQHLPSEMRVMAFRNGWNDWGIARRMLPPDPVQSNLGNWTLWSGTRNPSPP